MKILLILTAWLMVARCGCGSDWPQWRGPHRDGISDESIDPNWPAEGPKVLWRAFVGTGFASVSISQGRACTMGNTNNQDTISCLDARSGKALWKHSYKAQLSPQWYEGGPAATPTIDGNRVFTISKWGDVFCLDASSGDVVWQCALGDYGIKSNRWGFAGSPLVWQDLVIFNAAEAGLALERRTGKLVWRNGVEPAGYASPVLFRQGENEVVLIFAAKALVALDPRTGRELWRHPFKTDWDTNNPDPLVWGDQVFLSSFSHGCALVKATANGPQVVYDTKVLRNHLSPGILLGEYLYSFNGEAKTETDFRCIHLPTGKLQWTRADPAFGSLLYAHGKALVVSEKGEVMLTEISPTGCNVLARAKVLGGTCWIPPSLANGLLYVRNAKGELVCLDLPPAAAR